MVYTDGTELIADSLEELHLMAGMLDLPIGSFDETEKGYPHYELDDSYFIFEEALFHGVKQVEFLWLKKYAADIPHRARIT